MFKLLKDKLKSWISKTKTETEEVVVETPKPKEVKKTQRKPEKETKEEKQDKKIQKEVKKEKYIEPKKEFNFATKTPEPDIKKTKELIKEKEEVKEESLKEPEQQKQLVPEEKPEKKGFFSSLFGKKTTEPSKEEVEELIKEDKKKKRQAFSLFKRTLTEEKFEELFNELEMILLQNNVAYSAIQEIKKSLKEKLIGTTEKVENALKESIKELLINPPNFIKQIKQKQEKPYVILFAGINGSGKTTTIAKIAHLIKKNNLTVCLASADTFRAAAIEQLQIHATKLEIPLIKKDYGADPASVGFDAVKYAKKNNIDVVLIDTAGRMNNRDSLMKEIEKISRVNSPDLKIFLGESITGNDATEQAKDFNDAIQIDGIILSKADVDEKGGTAISVSQVTGKPIYFLGTGQTYDDLEIFEKQKLIEKLF